MAQFSVAPGFYLVERLEEDTSSETVIVALDSTKYPHARWGLVLAVGKKTRRDSPLFRVGDKIVYKSYGFEEIVSEGKKLHFVPFENVLAKVL